MTRPPYLDASAGSAVPRKRLRNPSVCSASSLPEKRREEESAGGSASRKAPRIERKCEAGAYERARQWEAGARDRVRHATVADARAPRVDESGQTDIPNPCKVVEFARSVPPRPYDLALLRWDAAHLKNVEDIYCYCGKGAFSHGGLHSPLSKPMITCAECEMQYHQRCIEVQTNVHYCVF